MPKSQARLSGTKTSHFEEARRRAKAIAGHLRIGNDSEDLEQDAALWSLKSEGKEMQAGYISQRVFGLALDGLRRRAKRENVERQIDDSKEVEEKAPDSCRPDEMFSRDEARRAVGACIKGLSLTHRVVIVELFFNNTSIKEAAEKLQMSEDACWRVRCKALDRMALALRKAGICKTGDIL